MATTAGGLPYPVGTDKVVDGDNAIKALADALQLRGGWLKMIMEQLIVTTNGAGGFSCTFSAPFGGVPYVICQDAGGTGTSLVVLAVTTPAAAANFTGVARQAAANGAPIVSTAIRVTFLATGLA